MDIEWACPIDEIDHSTIDSGAVGIERLVSQKGDRNGLFNLAKL